MMKREKLAKDDAARMQLLLTTPMMIMLLDPIMIGCLSSLLL